MRINRWVMLGMALGLGVIILFSGCAIEYIGPSSQDFTNPTLQRNLTYVEQLQTESDWFQNQGENRFSGYLSIFLTLEVLLGGLVSIFAGASIWGRKTNSKAVVCLILSVFVVIASAGAFYIKTENERFYKENRHQYIGLSHQINGLIKGFYMEFDSRRYNDENIEDQKQEFLELTAETYDEIDRLKMEYFNKYGLEINLP